jgi:acetylornithine deacetylase/succinyl-diaminopimelate desuccinylase-like protein
MSDIDRRRLLQGTAAAGLVALAPGAALGTRAKAPRLAPAAVHRAVADQVPDTIERIQRWIRQPSVSSTGQGIDACCKLTMEMLREAGFQTVKKMPTARHPGIFATLDAGARRTLALYFMYDVQPVEEKEWSSPPWKAEIVSLPEHGKVIMGRGAVNQKGPQGAFLAALHAIRRAHEKMPVNLVLVGEGEEEQGSPNFHQVVRRPEVVRALRRSVGIVMPGAEQKMSGTVEVDLGAKGILYVEIEASGTAWGRGPEVRDIHSSLAAVVDSPVWRLVEALQTLRSKDGNEPAIDGVAALVRAPSDADRKLYDALARSEDEAAFKKSIGVDHWVNDLGERAMLERLGHRPSINIDGIFAGYTGEGSKTILPQRATAKIDIRLVPDMKVDDVLAKLRAHLDRRGYKDLAIRKLGGYDPNQTRLDARLIQTQIQLYRARKLDVIIRPRRAGSWPGYLFTTAPVAIAAGHFGMGYGSGAHSKDEFYVVEPPSGAQFSGMAGAVSSFADYLYALASA